MAAALTAAETAYNTSMPPPLSVDVLDAVCRRCAGPEKTRSVKNNLDLGKQSLKWSKKNSEAQAAGFP